MSIDSFITYFLSYSNQGQILTHEGNYQQLYHTFFDFCSSQEQTLTDHFLEQLNHAFVEPYIDQGHILLQKFIF